MSTERVRALADKWDIAAAKMGPMASISFGTAAEELRVALEEPS